MNQPIGDERFQHAAECVLQWRRPLLLTHAKPDGDAIGSLVALQRLLRSRGSSPLAILFDDCPPRYADLCALGQLDKLGGSKTIDDLEGCDGVVLLDTCSFVQLAPVADWLRTSTRPKLAVDHHLTRDPIVDHDLVDTTAAATCLILYEWAISVGWPIDERTAAGLFVGLASDTGWFRHSNTDARALAIVAALARLGVEPHVWFERLFQRETTSRLRLRAEALSSLELLENDRLAILSLSREAFDRSRAAADDTEDLINEPLQIGSVWVSILLVEQEGGPVRVSFRSKPPVQPGDQDFDVAAFAQRFGGGGHRRAAGARIEGALGDVRECLVRAFTEATEK
jgi:phosphoesterase RecJ-like protein